MAFIKIANTDRKKPSLVSRITDANSGVGNKVMVKTDESAKADSGNQTISTHKVSEISFSFSPDIGTGTGVGDASCVVFSWCSDSSGSNPIAFFVAGSPINASYGAISTKRIKFPVPLESPYATSNISVHGIGVEECAGRSCSPKSTYTATTEVKMTT